MKSRVRTNKINIFYHLFCLMYANVCLWLYKVALKVYHYFWVTISQVSSQTWGKTSDKKDDKMVILAALLHSAESPISYTSYIIICFWVSEKFICVHEVGDIPVWIVFTCFKSAELFQGCIFRPCKAITMKTKTSLLTIEPCFLFYLNCWEWT